MSNYKGYLSLGANLGNAKQTITEAIRQLKADGSVTVNQISSWYHTKPWGLEEQPDFWNIVCSFQTQIELLPLLHKLQAIENFLGRERKIHWGPRTIDIDIIWVETEKNMISSKIPELILPHPYFWERLFVLEPLAEINPHFIYKNCSISQRIQELKNG